MFGQTSLKHPRTISACTCLGGAVCVCIWCTCRCEYLVVRGCCRGVYLDGRGWWCSNVDAGNIISLVDVRWPSRGFRFGSTDSSTSFHSCNKNQVTRLIHKHLNNGVQTLVRFLSLGIIQSSTLEQLTILQNSEHVRNGRSHGLFLLPCLTPSLSKSVSHTCNPC